MTPALALAPKYIELGANRCALGFHSLYLPAKVGRYARRATQEVKLMANARLRCNSYLNGANSCVHTQPVQLGSGPIILIGRVPLPKLHNPRKP
jgi:hypothetical protein